MHAAIFFFFFALFSPYSGSLAQPLNQYDHQLFVLTWPNGYCSGHACRKIPTNLVLHGLWPADSHGRILTGCRSEPMKDIPSVLETHMQTLWPSIGFGSDRDFWLHEWNKHGTCQKKPSIRYFINVIQLRRSIDLDSALREEVALGASAPRANYTRAITNTLGAVAPVFRCVRRNGNKLLSEIMICIDKYGGKVIPCSKYAAQHDNCGLNPIIKFPAKTE